LKRIFPVVAGRPFPAGFKLISADEIKAQRGKNLSRKQVYEIRKESKQGK